MIHAADDLLIFLHLPKAGGTTLRDLIGRHYTPDQYADLRNDRRIDEDVDALGLERRGRLQVLAGHVPYGVHERFDQPSTYFTFLRHPVDRLVSHYHYVRSNPRHFLHSAVIDAKLSLLEYVQSDLSEELENDQTRRLAGSSADQAVTYEDLILAQQHLRSHFAVVGVVERFDESLLLLSQARGWQPPYYLSRNVRNSDAPAAVAPEVREAILARNAFDLALYEEVRERFDHAIEARGPLFAADLERFRQGNRRYQRLRGAAEGLLQPIRMAHSQVKSWTGM